MLACASCSLLPQAEKKPIPCTFVVWQGNAKEAALMRPSLKIGQDDPVTGVTYTPMPTNDPMFSSCKCMCGDDWNNFLTCGKR